MQHIHVWVSARLISTTISSPVLTGCVNGNFLRFKTLEIGYRLPYCRIYLSGDNLAVFSPFKLWDPELAWNVYPFSRTFNLGVQFTF